MKPLIINVAALTLFASGVARADNAQEVLIANLEAAGKRPGKFPAALAQERRAVPAAQPLVLRNAAFKHYVDDFDHISIVRSSFGPLLNQSPECADAP